MNSPSKSFRPRAFTTLLVVLGFGMLLLSGGVLFLSPPGRIANWTQWQIFGLTKRAWTDLHVTFSALFLVAGVVHLVFNLRPLLQHIGARLSGRGGFRPEWVLALGVALAVFGATRAQLPPVASLIAWGEQLKAGWDAPSERAPIPHAELLSLEELATQAGVGKDEAVRRLEAAGVRNVALEAKVQVLADEAKMTPARVYDVIRGKGSTSPARSGSETPGHGPSSGGGGPGWKSLRQFCADEGLDLASAEARLAGRGLRSSPEMTLREIAVNNGLDRPYALLEILRQK